MSRRSKKIDKRMDQLRKEFKKSSLVLKKNKSALKKSATAARFAASLQAEPMLASAVTYIATLLAMGGKNKKAIRSMLEGVYPNVDVTPLLESFDGLMEELQHEALMEDEDGEFNLHDLKILIEFEPVLLEMISLTDEFESPVSTGRLTVAVLTEEVQNLKKSGKVASSDKVSKGKVKDEQLKMFFNLYSKFLAKMKELKIDDDAKIEKFLLTMINMVPRVNIKRKERVESKS